MKALSLIALAGLAVSLSSVANAATDGPYTGSVPDTLTTWGVPLGSVTQSIKKFDPALGTLTSVSFTLNGDATSTVTTTAVTTTTYYYSAGATIRLTRPDGSLLVQTIPTLTKGDAFNPLTQNAGTSSSSTGSATATNSASFSSASDLALFTGLGNIALPTQAAGFVTVSLIGGNATAGQSTIAGANVSVLYTYTPGTTAVPEPGSVAMLIAGGITGAGILIRRRK